MYSPTPAQIARARSMDRATLRRVHSALRPLCRPGKTSNPWRFVSALRHIAALDDLPLVTVALALVLPIAAGSLEARSTPKGLQVRATLP